VLNDAFADAQGEVQPAKARVANLEVLDHAQRVQVVIEALAKFLQSLVQGPLACMAKRRMPYVMHQRQGFGHVFVQLERRGDGARDLCHLHGVGEAAAKVIGVAVGKDLCFSSQAAKGPGMDDPGTVALERSSIRMGCFGVLSLRQQEAGVVRYGNARRQGKNLAPLVLRAGARRFFFGQFDPRAVEFFLHLVYVAGLGVRRYGAGVLREALFPLRSSQLQAAGLFV
jgi:hypothetical protein